MTKFPRKNRPLTVAIKGKIGEMPPDNGGVMEINGKRYGVRRIMNRYARNAQTAWKEYTLEPIGEDGDE